MRADISVLHVDDDPALLQLSEQFIVREDDRLAPETCTSATAALERLDEEVFDVVVSDFQMPGMDGLEFLERLRERGDDTPFIVFTGQGREEVAMQALNLGADRYIQKGGDPKSQYAVLSKAIVQVATHYRAQQALVEREAFFGTTLDSIGEAVLTTDLDGRITGLNPAAESLTGLAEDDVEGTHVDDVLEFRDPETDASAPLPIDDALDERRVVRNAAPRALVAHDGTRRQVADTVAPIERRDDPPYGVVVVLRDVSDGYARQRRSERQHNALYELATTRAINDGNVRMAQRRVTETAAHVLDVERVSVWFLEDDGESMRCTDLYTRSTGEHTRGTLLEASDYPAYFDALDAERVVDVADAVEDSRTRCLEDYLRAHDVASLLDAPIRVGGDVVGILCHEHVGDPRSWHDDELGFAGAAADQMAQAVTVRQHGALRSLVGQAEGGVTDGGGSERREEP